MLGTTSSKYDSLVLLTPLSLFLLVMSVDRLDRSQYALVIVCDAMVSPLLSDVTRTALIPKGLVKHWEGANSAQVKLLSDSLLGKLARLVVFGAEPDDCRLRGVVFRPSKVKADPSFWELDTLLLRITEP